MNELLEQKTKELIKINKKYFNDLKQQDILLIYLCDSLSSFGYYDESKELIKEELFNIFTYLYNNNGEKLKKVLSNCDKKNNLYSDTLKVINRLIYDKRTIDYFYKDIITICNTMTQKLYNINYEKFLLNYIDEKYKF